VNSEGGFATRFPSTRHRGNIVSVFWFAMGQGVLSDIKKAKLYAFLSYFFMRQRELQS